LSEFTIELLDRWELEYGILSIFQFSTLPVWRQNVLHEKCEDTTSHEIKLSINKEEP
jgi:hypothetical protein